MKSDVTSLFIMGKIYNEDMRKLFAKYSPAKILLASFGLTIFLGALFLSLDICSSDNVGLLDAFFTSTSATCVTGLLTVNAMKDFTILGQIVILMLIQIGGLGFMTFVTLTLNLVSRNLDLKERIFVKDSLNKSDFSDVGKYLKMIFVYTILIELVGFGLLLTQIYDGSAYSIFQTLFLSISAFCNAGIDIFGGNSLVAYQTNLLINTVVGILIILGGLGFAVISDVVNKTRVFIRMRNNFIKSLSFHTRLVIDLTIALILAGLVLIFGFEYNNALVGLNFFEKLEVSTFNSITLRTAGFATFDYGTLLKPTKILMNVFMVIGASPGGTGGGMKTTTFLLMLIAIKSQFTNRENMHLFGHHIKKINFIKSQAIFSVYFICIVLSLVIVTIYEPLDTLDLLFEICSAIGTVGLSCGITGIIMPFTKIVIIILMFIGRLGPITVAMSFGSIKKENKGIRYPSADIIVG